MSAIFVDVDTGFGVFVVDARQGSLLVGGFQLYMIFIVACCSGAWLALVLTFTSVLSSIFFCRSEGYEVYDGQGVDGVRKHGNASVLPTWVEHVVWIRASRGTNEMTEGERGGSMYKQNWGALHCLDLTRFSA